MDEDAEIRNKLYNMDISLNVLQLNARSSSLYRRAQNVTGLSLCGFGTISKGFIVTVCIIVYLLSLLYIRVYIFFYVGFEFAWWAMVVRVVIIHHLVGRSNHECLFTSEYFCHTPVAVFSTEIY